MKGALFCDIDGTLLPYGQTQISPSLLATLKEAVQKDWMLCIVTGRAYESVRQTLPALADDAYFCCSSGACLFFHGREVMPSAFLDRKTVEELMEDARRYHASLIFSVPEGMYSMGTLYPYTENLFRSQHTSPKPVEHLDQFPSDRICVVTFQFPQKREIPEDALRRKWQDRIFWGVGGPALADAGRMDKGRAVMRILDYFHIPHEQSYAFGDYDNDLPMLRAVAHGFLMADTGHKALLKIFPHHCQDIEATIRQIISRT